jgi:hypothetical protein
MFGSSGAKVKGIRRKSHNGELHNYHSFTFVSIKEHEMGGISNKDGGEEKHIKL